VEQLRGVRFEWRSVDERTIGKDIKLPIGQPQIGMIAQEVARVAPEVVSAPGKAATGAYSLNEANLVPLLIEAVKEQQAQIEQLRAELAALKAAR
jgi:hypothetical protein